jgi:hypothetical protein
MLEFIYSTGPLNWILLGFSIFLFLKKFESFHLKSAFDLKNRAIIFLLLATTGLIGNILSYLTGLTSLPDKAKMFASNPFLLLILTTNQKVESFILKNTSEWLSDHMQSMMFAMLVIIVYLIFWYLINTESFKIEKNKPTISNMK